MSSKNTTDTYKSARALMEAKDYLKALQKLKTIKGFQDVDNLIEECIRKLDLIYKEAMDAFERNEYDEAIKLFFSISSYKDAEEMIRKCQSRIHDDSTKDEKLREASKALQYYNYIEALTILKEIQGHKNADELIELCIEKLDELYNQAIQLLCDEKYSEAKVALLKIKPYKDTAELIEKCEKMDKWLVYAEKKYNDALYEFNNKKYLQALKLFTEVNCLDDEVVEYEYKDTSKYIQKCNAALEEKYKNAVKLFKAGEYDKAKDSFKELIGYKDSLSKYDDCISKKKEAAAKALKRKESTIATIFAILHVIVAIVALFLVIALAIILFSNKLQVMAASNYGGWVFGWIVLLILSIAAIIFNIGAIVYSASEDKEGAIAVGTPIVLISFVVLGIFGGIGFGNSSKLKPSFDASTLLEFSITNEERGYNGTVTLEFNVVNDTKYDINYFKGDMYFYNNNNQVAKYYVDCKGSFNGQTRSRMTVNYYNADSIANVPYENLGVTYTLTKIGFRGDKVTSIKGTKMIVKDNGSDLSGGQQGGMNESETKSESNYYADGVLGNIQRYVSNNQVVIPDNYIKYTNYQENYRYFSYYEVQNNISNYKEYNSCRVDFYMDISEYYTLAEAFASKLAANGFTKYYMQDYHHGYDYVDWEIEYRKGNLVIEISGPYDGDEVYNPTYNANEIVNCYIHFYAFNIY